MVFSNKYTCVSSFRIAAALCKMVLRRTPDSWERREVSKVLLEKEKLPATTSPRDGQGAAEPVSSAGAVTRESVRAAMYKLVSNDGFIDMMVRELRQTM